MTKVERLIKRAGSINRLAADCGITRQAVQNWKKRGLPRDPALRARLGKRYGVKL